LSTSIRPQLPQRIAGTAWQQTNVEVAIDGLTLAQLVQFLHQLDALDPDMNIVAMTLLEPRGDGAAAGWTVDPLVLGYTVYAPKGGH
jgi:hypothetical protein